MENHHRKHIQRIIENQVKIVLSEKFDSGIKQFIERQKKHTENGTVAMKVIDKLLRQDNPETYMQSLVSKFKNSKPFDKINTEPGLEGANALMVVYAVNDLFEKWELNKHYYL